jgi:L,D-peptidoglycan transpeptidase YkuD (ErfK/YbiS/YcfS/YnhG family)
MRTNTVAGTVEGGSIFFHLAVDACPSIEGCNATSSSPALRSLLHKHHQILTSGCFQSEFTLSRVTKRPWMRFMIL